MVVEPACSTGSPTSMGDTITHRDGARRTWARPLGPISAREADPVIRQLVAVMINATDLLSVKLGRVDQLAVVIAQTQKANVANRTLGARRNRVPSRAMLKMAAAGSTSQFRTCGMLGIVCAKKVNHPPEDARMIAPNEKL